MSICGPQEGGERGFVWNHKGPVGDASLPSAIPAIVGCPPPQPPTCVAPGAGGGAGVRGVHGLAAPRPLGRHREGQVQVPHGDPIGELRPVARGTGGREYRHEMTPILRQQTGVGKQGDTVSFKGVC